MAIYSEPSLVFAGCMIRTQDLYQASAQSGLYYTSHLGTVRLNEWLIVLGNGVIMSLYGGLLATNGATDPPLSGPTD